MSSPHTSSRNASQATLADPSALEQGPEPTNIEHKDESNSPRLHRVVSPGATGPFGSSAPGAGDTTGLPPPHSKAEADEEQRELDHADEVREEKGEKNWEVKFEEGDMENPMNWSSRKRWYICFCSASLVLNSTFSSSAPSGVVPEMMRHFGMSQEVATLVISLFVAGYVVGPLFWGPMSETYGRRILLIIAFTIYFLLQIGSALAPNTGAVLAFRFLGGIAASCPLVVTGGVLGDVFPPAVRGMAISIFVVAPFAGPAIGPIVGGFLADSGQPWDILFWVLFAFAGFCLALIIFTLPETYAPVLLVRKAKRLRKENPGQPWFAPLEKKKTGFKARANDVCVRPFKMLIEEPMLLAITIYMSVIYGILYLNFVAYPIIFQQGHHFRAGPSGLMFLPLFVGSIVAALLSAFYYNPRFIKASSGYPPFKSPPELRLDAALLGAPMLPIAIFWLAFTSYPSIHWAAPMMSGLLLGMSLILLFLPLMNYIIDTYLFAAATALAANTVVRSLFGAGFPLFAKQMYVALNPRFAGLVLGLVCVALMPIPFVFLKFGPVLRKRSKNAANK